MDVRALEALRAVRSQGGVTRAAAVLHLTPSAVSQHLASLTRQAGVPLTERAGRGLRLTAAGLALAGAADDVAVALERARTAVRDAQEASTGSVSVSAFSSGAELLLPGLLTRLAGSGVEVECTDEDVPLDDFAPLTDRIDVVIAHRPEGERAWVGSPGVRVVPLLREPLDVAVPVGDPLVAVAAEHGGVRPADLAGQRWIAVKEGFPVAEVLRTVRGAGPEGGQPSRVVSRINDFHVVLELVAARHGASLLPRYTCGRHPGVRLLPLLGVRAGRQVDALVRADTAERPVVRRVLTELTALAAELAGGAGGAGGA
ncbi:LysR family transcriptional regulator [Streptomyces sp. NP160]|uniref:LysR family transcriptional regulator n=1 Tax=Streptomyces sp. NP160 TaxID=2586637 RepID=UPI001119CCC4|nr:LysR family transcriptional regulator [Streptomyces sp. NP160]TNM61541.1 LysR family transcriptional regulator [Streptomyces sp. NP160]